MDRFAQVSIWRRPNLPSASLLLRLLLPLVFGVAGATVGAGFVALTLNQFFATFICLLLPIGPLALVLACALVGFFTSLVWLGEAWLTHHRMEAQFDVNLQKRLRRLLAAQRAPLQTEAASHRQSFSPSRVSECLENEVEFSRILGEIPRPVVPRWKRLDPAALPPYPLLVDCCHRPLPRQRMK